MHVVSVVRGKVLVRLTNHPVLHGTETCTVNPYQGR